MALATLAAFGAILLWATLASLSVLLSGVPPLLITGLALAVGGVVMLPMAKRWTWDPGYVFLGCAAVVGYHAMLFWALRSGPALSVNLINYLWPLGVVTLAPVFGVGRYRWQHIAGAGLGFSGAAIALGLGSAEGFSEWTLGHVLAFGVAAIWSSYTLLLRRYAYVTSETMGLVCLLSGILSLGLSVATEPFTLPDSGLRWAGLLYMGVGPLGIAFLFWDFAAKRLPAVRLGSYSYLTPILSTTFLSFATHRALDLRIAVALGLVLSGAALGNRAR